MTRETHTEAADRGTESTTDDTAADGTDERPGVRSGVGRRALLWALGAGAGLAAAGTAPAAAATDDAAAPTPSSAAEIDPVYGFATPDAEDVPSGLQPDHTVELHVEEGVPWEPGQPRNTAHGPLFHFEPTGLAVDEGDVVQFTAVTPDHSVTAYHPKRGYQRRVPENVPAFSSPVVSAGAAWLYQFDEPGLYDVFCAPHHILGMTMRLVVGDLPENEVPCYEDTFEGQQGPPPLLAPFSKELLESELERFSEQGENVNLDWVWLTPREVLDTAALDPSNIQAEGPVAFDEVLADIDRIDAGTHDG